ncbi:metallophosphoesterase [Streptacidiphilus pinicola]|uniref:Metallophosphoesterase n=1 Tax=Streptacidiphilus pinicola TaxID=2219663 RepID=A0A2X0IBA7_9ACTN|nr:metallophosphoesterase [Streptacidiphilus pinicola]RAG82242.1 metallophosphoesterase [Streptacidiphilus pinicola]
MTERSLLAVSDLHVRHQENRRVVERLAPRAPGDWLLVAGDVGEAVADVEWALGRLAGRFEKVVWVPGNHELWTPSGDPVQLRGDDRYRLLVDLCRGLGVVTPEDPYPVWDGPGGPVVVAPLFVLYDYSFRSTAAHDVAQALAAAADALVVSADEAMLHPHPYASRQEWCRARLAFTEARLETVDPTLPTVLVNHFPLVRTPTGLLRHPEVALWCGTEATADWPRRFRAAAVVYGHLHMPGLFLEDGVPHYEVSLGYPREWRHHGDGARLPVSVLPAARTSGRPR